MPMDVSILQPEIKAAFKSAAAAYGKDNSEAYLDTLSLKLAAAVITHIQNMAEVTGGSCVPGGPISGGKVL